MDSTQNTTTSGPNTVLSSDSRDVFTGVITENQPYSSYVEELPSNYAFDNSTLQSTVSINDDNNSSVTICDDIMPKHEVVVHDDQLLDESIHTTNNTSNSTTTNRRVRFKYTKSQLRRFEDYFRMNMFPDSITREEISKELNIPVRNVQVWFKNRRAKHRKSAQLDSSNISYLENSTILHTPERSIQPSNSNYSTFYGNPIPQQYQHTPQSNQHPNFHHHQQSSSSMYMMNPFQLSNNTNQTYIMKSNNHHMIPSPLTVSPLTANSRMINYQNYGHVVPGFYRNEKYLNSSAPPLFTVPTQQPQSQNRATQMQSNASPFMVAMATGPVQAQQRQMFYSNMVVPNENNMLKRENRSNTDSMDVIRNGQQSPLTTNANRTTTQTNASNISQECHQNDVYMSR